MEEDARAPEMDHRLGHRTRGGGGLMLRDLAPDFRPNSARYAVSPASTSSSASSGRVCRIEESSATTARASWVVGSRSSDSILSFTVRDSKSPKVIDGAAPSARAGRSRSRSQERVAVLNPAGCVTDSQVVALAGSGAVQPSMCGIPPVARLCGGRSTWIRSGRPHALRNAGGRLPPGFGHSCPEAGRVPQKFLAGTSMER